ncbi:MAG: hypothetical protein N2556_09790, partial [Anaerolineae bacterium]|nr:hypothetical protein [Anaerolineae bacterium]
MSEIQWLVAAAMAIGVGLLLLKVGQAIARFLVIGGCLVVAGLIALAFLKQAEATRAVATTASIAATGQAATSASLSAAVILFLLLAGGSVAAYLYFRHRRQRPARTAWLPGPYAYWKQMAGPETSALPAPPPAFPYPPVQYYPPYPAYPPVYPIGAWTWPVVYYPPPDGPEEEDLSLIHI